MNAPRRSLRALVAALLGCLLLSGCDFDVYQLPLPGGADTGDDPMTITVEFADVLDLVPKSSVKVNDVTVGQVTDVELDEKSNTATVTIELRSDTELPELTTAQLRQTSLLGEKFVALEASPDAGGALLEDGDTIPIEQTGRNPEVEEVFGALSLLLNGGGVAQLKTIVSELNNTFEGREDTTKSVLRQIQVFMGQLDDNKEDIVDAIESVNRLALGVREQQRTIDATLEELPSSLRSLDRQRDDLVRMLQALNRLSGVGTRVVLRSKNVTIKALQQLAPTLTELANSGDDFVDSFNVFLTYPFVDEVVGRDPQVARNLHMGDYTNLSVQLDIDLSDLDDNPPVVPDVCFELGQLPDDVPLKELCDDALRAVNECIRGLPDLSACPEVILGIICERQSARPVCDLLEGGGPLPQLPPLPDILGGNGPLLPEVPGLPQVPGLNRTSPDLSPPARGPTVGQLSEEFDPALVSLLVPGMVVR